MLKPYYTSIDLTEVEISNETIIQRVNIKKFTFLKLIFFNVLLVGRSSAENDPKRNDRWHWWI